MRIERLFTGANFDGDDKVLSVPLVSAAAPVNVFLDVLRELFDPGE